MEPTPSPAPLPDEERDALRIQAAAVVAQQAALTEEELRLQQRRGSLERQEEQLANHLEEKRRHLIDLREQLKAERDTFRAERAEEEHKLTARHKQAEAAFAEADEVHKLAHKEKDRLVELRKRLKERWESHFAAHEAELRKREEEVSAAASRLAVEAEGLEGERAAIARQRLEFSGEMELGRRQLEQAWDELGLAERDRELRRKQDLVDHEQRARELMDRERNVARAERELAAEKNKWEQIKLTRAKESEGLEARIRNQRLKLQGLEQALANAQAQRPDFAPFDPVTPTDIVPEPIERIEAPVALKRLAGCLADQRLHLLDQWRGVLELQDDWQRQRETLLAELETHGKHLADREQRLDEREREVVTRSTELERRHEALFQLRCSLEGRQARLKANSLEWDAQRTSILADAQTSQESAATRVRRLEMLCRRTLQRHRSDAAALREARRRCEETRKQYFLLWEEACERTRKLQTEQQSMASETLVLEQLRLEIISKSENVAAAEKRLDKLRRQNSAITQQAEADLERERTALRTEAARLEERGTVLKTDEERILVWRRKLAKRQVQVDRRTGAAQSAEQERLQQMQRLVTQHEQDALQLRELREEVERLARLLIGDDRSPSHQAA